MPFFAACAVGIVLFVALFFNRLDLGLVAVLGANVFLYVPNTPIYHRMAVTMCCSFGIVLSFALGFLTHFAPFSIPFVVFVVAVCSGILVRYYDIGVPGYFFFVFSCLLGTFLPFEIEDFPMLVGLVSLGTICANAMALLYSLSVVYFFKNKQPSPIPVRGKLGYESIIIESLIMGLFVGISTFVGQILGLERSYWVAVSCTAVMQGISLNAIWIKQSQRIIGTFVGMFFALFVFSLEFSPYVCVLFMIFLFFMGEFSVTRNYALTMIFITPYITYLVQMTQNTGLGIDFLVELRMLDVILGCILGLLGGVAMYNKALRSYCNKFARKIFH